MCLLQISRKTSWIKQFSFLQSVVNLRGFHNVLPGNTVDFSGSESLQTERRPMNKWIEQHNWGVLWLAWRLAWGDCVRRGWPLFRWARKSLLEFRKCCWGEKVGDQLHVRADILMTLRSKMILVFSVLRIYWTWIHSVIKLLIPICK